MTISEQRIINVFWGERGASAPFPSLSFSPKLARYSCLEIENGPNGREISRYTSFLPMLCALHTYIIAGKDP